MRKRVFFIAISLLIALAFPLLAKAETGSANLNHGQATGNIPTFEHAADTYDSVACHQPLVSAEDIRRSIIAAGNAYEFSFPGCDTITTASSRFVMLQVTPLVSTWDTTNEKLSLDIHVIGTQPEIWVYEYSPLAAQVLTKTAKTPINSNYNISTNTPYLTVSTVTSLPDESTAQKTSCYRGSLYNDNVVKVPLGVSNLQFVQIKSRASNDPISWWLQWFKEPK